MSDHEYEYEDVEVEAEEDEDMKFDDAGLPIELSPVGRFVTVRRLSEDGSWVGVGRGMCELYDGDIMILSFMGKLNWLLLQEGDKFSMVEDVDDE